MWLKSFFFLLFIVCGLCLTGTILADEPTAKIAGTWSITIEFVAGTGHHTAIIKQNGEKLTGVYKGEIKEGTLRGIVKGNSIDFTGFLRHKATGVRFHYTGTIDGDTMKGTVDMGEYWTAKWTAKRAKK